MEYNFRLFECHSTIEPREYMFVFETTPSLLRNQGKIAIRIAYLDIDEMRVNTIRLPISVQVSVSQLLNPKVRFRARQRPNSLNVIRVRSKVRLHPQEKFTFRPTSRSKSFFFFFSERTSEKHQNPRIHSFLALTCSHSRSKKTKSNKTVSLYSRILKIIQQVSSTYL